MEFPGVNSGYTGTFKTVFFKTFYEVTASTNKDFIVKIGYHFTAPFIDSLQRRI